MSNLRFRAGIAKYSDLAMLLAYVGDSDPFEAPTKVIVLDEAGSRPEWGLENLDDVYVDVCTFKTDAMDRPAFVCVSEEGRVWFHLRERIVEDIPEAGLRKPTSLKLGYIGGIRQLGQDLFTFGYAGQIYRRSAPDKWESFDAGILGNSADKYDVSDICVAEDTFFAVTRMGGKGRIYSKTSDRWKIEANPSGEWLNAIQAGPDGIVWACGRNGTILKGSASTPFELVGDPECNDEFLSLVLYRGKLWLSSATSIYIYEADRLSKVRAGIPRDIWSANRLQVVDDVLWSFGPEDILRFDGQEWTRFICPGTQASSVIDADNGSAE